MDIMCHIIFVGNGPEGAQGCVACPAGTGPAPLCSCLIVDMASEMQLVQLEAIALGLGRRAYTIPAPANPLDLQLACTGLLRTNLSLL